MTSPWNTDAKPPTKAESKLLEALTSDDLDQATMTRALTFQMLSANIPDRVERAAFISAGLSEFRIQVVMCFLQYLWDNTDRDDPESVIHAITKNYTNMVDGLPGLMATSRNQLNLHKSKFSYEESK